MSLGFRCSEEGVVMVNLTVTISNNIYRIHHEVSLTKRCGDCHDNTMTTGNMIILLPVYTLLYRILEGAKREYSMKKKLFLMCAKILHAWLLILLIGQNNLPSNIIPYLAILNCRKCVLFDDVILQVAHVSK